MEFTVKYRSISDKKELTTLTGHSTYVLSVAISNDLKYLASGSVDKTVKLWSFEDKKEIISFSGHTSTVRSVIISYDRKFLISGSGDKTIKVWNIDEKKIEFSLIGHLSAVRFVAICKSGSFIASAEDDKTIKIWSFKDQRIHIKWPYEFCLYHCDQWRQQVFDKRVCGQEHQGMELKRKKGRMQFDWTHLWHSISCHIKRRKILNKWIWR